jgi:nitrite reductase (NADH) small subunit
MPHFIRLAAESELPAEGEAKEFSCKIKDVAGNEHGDKVICVANVNGIISAMDNGCLHRGGPLGQGIIEGNKVVCPWHGWQFEPQTGEATHNPKAKVAVYPIKIENGEFMIELPDLAS